MKCPWCDSDNATGHRFCGHCGRPLPRSCTRCGFENAPDARFCSGCGLPLAAAGEVGGPAGNSSGGERRQLTVLFCDLVDSTRIGREHDPEALQQLLRGLRRLCSDCVHRYDGVVTQFLGDGILACFGYPLAHEDDAERAVRAALALLRAVAERRRHEALPLRVRLGVATGLVVTSDETEGRTALLAMIGEPLAMAARLQSLAPADGIVIGPLTRELVGDQFELEELGEHRLKGFAGTVRAWRVLGERRGVDRFGSRRTAVGLCPFVGREREQALLAGLWDDAVAGHGRAVILTGEAGIGKSRTIAHFLAAIGHEPHVRVRYFCVPYHRDSPFHPVLEHLERAAGIQASAPAEERRRRLSEMLRELGRGDEEAVALCARMLGCAANGPVGGGVDALERERFHEVLLSLLGRVASRSPVVMLVEDAHWLDPSTGDFLARVVAALPRLPMLLVLTTRPEFLPPWRDEPHVAVLSLSRLDPLRVRELIASVAGPAPVTDAMVDEIAARSDGVPLFVEELTRHLLSRASAGDAHTAPVPDTLRDLLTARLDSLGSVRLVAQAAAVLGRHFRVDLLRRMLGISPEELALHLARLRETGLAVVQGDPPEAIGSFRHALIQDVAVESLLRERRQMLHQRVAEIMEREFPELAARHPELVASHFDAAGLAARAVPWHLAAGDQARARYAGNEARAHYHLADAAARAAAAGGEQGELLARCAVALAAVARNREEVLADLARLDVAERAVSDPLLRAELRYWAARLHYVLGHFDDAVHLAEASLELARTAGDSGALCARPVNLLARLACLRGRGGEAVAYASQNISEMQRLGDRVETAAMTGVLAFGLALLGRFEEAARAADDGVALASAVGHLPTLAAAHCYRGVVHAWRGDAEHFTADFAATIELAERCGDLFRSYLAHGWRGQGQLLAHAFEAAADDLETAEQLAARLGTSFHLGAFTALRAKLALLRGRATEAEELVQRAVRLAEESRQPWGMSIALRVTCETLLARSRPAIEAALAAVDRAIAIQEESQSRYDLAWSLLARSHALAAAGRREDATSELARAASLFAEMGVPRGCERVAEARTLLL
ncbi:Adenylate cyclase 2 [bacterium HR40]|nr:Adenylate cyclase 2 [bacterium HR40]